MILTRVELESLLQASNRTPHHLLGMHPLGDGGGVVVRALLPHAVAVEAVPTMEENRPAIKLERVQKSALFEGVSKEADRVYAYELIVTDDAGDVQRMRDPYSFLPTLGEMDLYLFGQGKENRIFDKLGSHLRTIDGVVGTSFAVWAPNARRVSIVGDFNGWDGRSHAMRTLGASGVWELFIPGLGEGTLYKYEIKDAHGAIVLKTDPYGAFFELAPKNASIVWNTHKFAWSDEAWIKKRRGQNAFPAPMSIYEVHPGSW